MRQQAEADPAIRQATPDPVLSQRSPAYSSHDFTTDRHHRCALDGVREKAGRDFILKPHGPVSRRLPGKSVRDGARQFGRAIEGGSVGVGQ